MSQKTISIIIHREQTISDLKEYVADKENIVSSHYKLFLGGRELHPEQKVSYYGIEDGWILHMIPVTANLTAIRPPGEALTLWISIAGPEKRYKTLVHLSYDTLGSVRKRLELHYAAMSNCVISRKKGWIALDERRTLCELQIWHGSSLYYRPREREDLLVARV